MRTDREFEKLATELDLVPRLGKDKDEPEGSRYVMVSDTLLLRIANAFRLIAGKDHHA